MELDEPGESQGRPAERTDEAECVELPTPMERTQRPRSRRGLMDLPHEIILRIIDEVILFDRATGHDQIRAHSATYALSRTSAYWQGEVENRHRVLYIQTSLFPGFARWSMHSDWLFKKNSFKPTDSQTHSVDIGREPEPSLAIPRPKTQASSFALIPADFQKPNDQESTSSISSDAMSVSSGSTYALSSQGPEDALGYSALSISGSKKSFASTVSTSVKHVSHETEVIAAVARRLPT